MPQKKNPAALEHLKAEAGQVTGYLMATLSCTKNTAFADVSEAMRNLGIKDDNAFAEHLLVEAGVAVVPGSGFGAPGHIRISFACSMEMLEDALRRIGRLLSVAVAKRA